MYDKRELSVEKAENLSDDSFERLADMTAAAFANDPSFGFLFGSSEYRRRFIGLCLKYYYLSHQMYLCTDSAGELCGVSCWVEDEGEPMSKRSMKKYGIFNEFKRFMLSLPVKSLYRVGKLADATKKTHIKQPHCYLVLVASFRKGAGSRLVNDYVSAHPSETIYLENSNMDGNTGFYTKHGFESLKEVRCGSLRILSMIRRSED